MQPSVLNLGERNLCRFKFVHPSTGHVSILSAGFNSTSTVPHLCYPGRQISVSFSSHKNVLTEISLA